MAQHQKINTITMILVITMAAVYQGATAQSSGCTSALISMSPCLNYISGNISTPSSGCCTQLANVVRSQPECLCEVLNGGGSSSGLNINQTQALELPKACNVQTPPASRCNVASPTNSPSGIPENPTGSGTQTNTVPSTDNGSSGATSTRFTTVPIVLALLVGIYTMAF